MRCGIEVGFIEHKQVMTESAHFSSGSSTAPTLKMGVDAISRSKDVDFERYALSLKDRHTPMKVINGRVHISHVMKAST